MDTDSSRRKPRNDAKQPDIGAPRIHAPAGEGARHVGVLYIPEQKCIPVGSTDGIDLPRLHKMFVWSQHNLTQAMKMACGLSASWGCRVSVHEFKATTAWRLTDLVVNLDAFSDGGLSDFTPEFDAELGLDESKYVHREGNWTGA